MTRMSFARMWRSSFPYLLMAPSMAAIAIIILYPIGRAIYTSFHFVDLMRPLENQRFVGFDQYRYMFSEPAFWRSLWITLVYTAGMAVGTFLFGLAGALLLNVDFRGRGFARTIIVMPWAISPAVASLTWTWMLDRDFGVVNYILVEAGLVSERVSWLSNGTTALLAVTVVTIWKFTPIAVVMLLAALQTVPEQLYEAARLDGATRVQLLRYVTLPGISPVSILLFNLLVLWGFRRFEFIFIMTQGGPAGATETLIIKTYQEAFRYWDIGYASAIGTFTLVIALLFSIGYLAMMSRREGGTA